MYKVYVKTDGPGRIVSVNSDAFLPDTDGWTLIDEGDGDRFHHAQGNYLPLPIVTDEGVWRYKLADGQVQERTQAEIDIDTESVSAPPPSNTDRIEGLEREKVMANAKIEVLVEQNEFYADLIQELAMIVYA